VSATLTPGVLKSAAKWCPDPDIVFLQPGMVQAETSVQKPREHSDGQPAWGWGVQAGGAFAKAGGSSAAGVGNQDSVPAMPPTLQHAYIIAAQRHKVDSVRRAVHALSAERVLIFMNFQQRIKDTQAKVWTNAYTATCPQQLLSCPSDCGWAGRTGSSRREECALADCTVTSLLWTAAMCSR